MSLYRNTLSQNGGGAPASKRNVSLESLILSDPYLRSDGFLFGKEQVVSTEGILSSIGGFFKWIWEKLSGLLKKLFGDKSGQTESIADSLLRLTNEIELLRDKVNKGELTKLDLRGLEKGEYGHIELTLAFSVGFLKDDFKRAVQEAVEKPFSVVEILLKKYNGVFDEHLAINEHETEKKNALYQDVKTFVETNRKSFIDSLSHEKSNIYIFKNRLLTGVNERMFLIGEGDSESDWKVEPLSEELKTAIREETAKEYKGKLKLEDGWLKDKSQILKMLDNAKDFFKRTTTIAEEAGLQFTKMLAKEFQVEDMDESLTEEAKEAYKGFKETLLRLTLSIRKLSSTLMSLGGTCESWVSILSAHFK